MESFIEISTEETSEAQDHLGGRGSMYININVIRGVSLHLHKKNYTNVLMKNARVYTVRESQGETDLLCFGQGKSGKLAVVRGNIAFSFRRSGESFIFHHQRNMRSGEKLAYSEEVREKHIGFREISQGKFVLLKQTSGEFFSGSPYKP